MEEKDIRDTNQIACLPKPLLHSSVFHFLFVTLQAKI